MKSLAIILSLSLFACAHAPKTDSQKETGRQAIQAMAGCFLVDYNYAEAEGLKRGYTRDKRVYDVNTKRSVKEWIYAEDLGPNRVRLQHLLFAADDKGAMIEDSKLKHQAEDWEYSASHLYEFTAPYTWKVKTPAANTWTRRVTNLDDGLRYQCAAQWKTESAYREWSCANYSPIPGRETRDMGRKDYDTLDRHTRLIVYGESWLERQNNVKTIHKGDTRTPLARENGKNWYVRLPDSECTAIREYAKPRLAFWALLRESWDEVFQERTDFVEKNPNKGAPRWALMMGIENRYLNEDLSKPETRARAKGEILALIKEYRAQNAVSSASAR